MTNPGNPLRTATVDQQWTQRGAEEPESQAPTPPKNSSPTSHAPHYTGDEHKGDCLTTHAPLTRRDSAEEIENCSE
ncbi:hypothetical protein F2Q69_00063961 [Brassica cretica]|uniref:Uncharacterized protein n=1 Tax=Brassica cretica TaxID=69181 RepID=A0A8S9N1X6_BRACR|nr:hypothetical protein F2Q69_00063961 [Brassica cretica]